MSAMAGCVVFAASSCRWNYCISTILCRGLLEGQPRWIIFVWHTIVATGVLLMQLGLNAVGLDYLLLDMSTYDYRSMFMLRLSS